MSEEFDESDIIFSDNHFPIVRRDDMNEKGNRPVDFRENSRNKSRMSKTTPLPSPAAFSTSLPVNIPGNMMRRRYSEDEEYSGDEGGRKMIPPHLMVGRRMEGSQMAFSVCTGNGRTLKGRDLSRLCYVDASWVSNSHKAGIGWFLTSPEGKALIQGSASISPIESVLEAEAYALREAIMKMRSLGYDKVIFCGDNKDIYSLLQELKVHTGNHHDNINFLCGVTNLLGDILYLSKNPFDFGFRYVPRSINARADTLARDARRLESNYKITWY